MKKSKLSITLMAALLSVGALVGCDNNPVKPSPKGVIVSYTMKGGNGEITADDVLVKYYQDSTKYESIFNAIKSVVIKNYFTQNEDVVERGTGNSVKAGLADVDGLKITAHGNVESEKLKAQTNAHTNKTSYKKEMDKVFKANGVENEQQLEEKFLEDLKEDKFLENMRAYHMDEMRDGYKRPANAAEQLSNEDETLLENMWTGYLNDMLPYHVSHLLVNIDDSSTTNYHNGTISQANCEKLYNVVESLTAGNKNFNKLAKENSDDTGSKVDGGALGLMEYSTGYIDEFKLGLYAYEELYGKNVDGAVKTKIAIPNGEDGSETKQVHNDFVEEFKKSAGITDLSDIPTIDVNVFKELKEVSKQEKSIIKVEAGSIEYEHEENVMGGSSFAYPRNIIFNKELNKHTFAFITTNDPKNDIKDSEVGTAGFHKYTEGKLASDASILSIKGKNGIRPILVVRGGTSGDSGYQGIHFIVVNRDPFEDDTNAKQYYSTVRPEEEKFITSTVADTYVNYNVVNDSNELDKRIENLENKFENYDNDKLNKFIVRKYMKKQGLKIADNLLDYELNRWIDNTIQVAKDKEDTSRVAKWRDYTKVLADQNKDRKDLMPDMARIAFDLSVNSKIITADVETRADFTGSGEIGFSNVAYDTVVATINGKKDAVETAEADLADAVNKVEGALTVEKAQENLEKAKDELIKEAVKSFDNYAAYLGLRVEDVNGLKTAIKDAADAKEITRPGEGLTLADLYNMKGAIFNDGQTH